MLHSALTVMLGSVLGIGLGVLGFLGLLLLDSAFGWLVTR